MKKLALALLISMSILFSFQASAHLHAFVGFSPNFSGLGTARIGWKDYEIGRYSTHSIAVNKLFKMSQSVYGAFGAGLVLDSFGFVASMGFNYDLFLGFGIRGELFAEQAVDGYSHGAGLLGASWNF